MCISGDSIPHRLLNESVLHEISISDELTPEVYAELSLHISVVPSNLGHGIINSHYSNVSTFVFFLV